MKLSEFDTIEIGNIIDNWDAYDKENLLYQVFDLLTISQEFEVINIINDINELYEEE